MLELLKKIFFLLLIIQIAPGVIKTISKQYNSFFETKTRVGTVRIDGGIYSAEKHTENLKSLFEDNTIKAILLKIECPGGAAGSSQAIFNELVNLKEQYGKPVVALVENISASGGYYITCAADHIVAAPSAIIGSIGTYISNFQLKNFIESHNIKYEVFKAGKYKTAGSMFTETQENERKMFEDLAQDAYTQFVNDVKQRRPQLAAIDENLWAQGRVVTGNVALKLGLVDEVGSELNAIKAIREKAPIEGEIEWVSPAKKFNLWSFLNGQDHAENKSFISWVSSIFTGKPVNETEQNYIMTKF